MHPSLLSISDFSYDLPEDRIALYPAAGRDDSKLLVYKNEEILITEFRNIITYLPDEALLIFNDTKVINARIIFQKNTGSKIEIFCLEPADHSFDLKQYGRTEWICLVGGAAKWKGESLQKEVVINGIPTILTAIQKSRNDSGFLIEFSWEPSSFSFEEIIAAAGLTPLPPYIKRNAGPEDEERYQTVYANHSGSVAAPTAGLHFTNQIIENLSEKKIASDFVTLHVGAGTFKPVNAEIMSGHKMHAEWISVKQETIEKLRNHSGPIIPVGTTSMRTIETLYWLGVKTLLVPEANGFSLGQWEIYEEPLSTSNISRAKALQALIERMKRNNEKQLIGFTELMIAPGYTFRMAEAIITNFHQPRSTLLLLVAAAAGENWKNIYETAINNDFRFLSYGDSSLIYIKNQG